jgi:hypothetical protein
MNTGFPASGSGNEQSPQLLNVGTPGAPVALSGGAKGNQEEFTQWQQP